MQRILKNGLGWRLGWNPQEIEYQGLVGTDDWAIELTGDELDDFCRLLIHLSQTMEDMAGELMDEEKISCEAESDLIWMEVEGYPDAYSVRLILNRGRRCEGSWNSEAVAGLVAGVRSLKIF
ncbi:MAG TPA: DUF1818 domain-containing protein [Cyanobacteria bacterium UBA11149]|nr:DUF1818 domain-containing protein [Cyanobacteria bacterium UBA11367]HBE59140.1 DUF1818 domain-containing protein [Cyanobacteria bacterium UBA11366]HBK63275.1 DUF1818 domain-containing protein [Cyanobacteria bacterium UBA11166]HBR73698.1 DUF1818 domain-containing protein [Cyanobacteria bacterium UBA11159]HBS68635.1 DUF1818 domain-containing protein [Cyanobacteria bacterium UBA11153]HBW87310.1 DUF1818 domain-containing protein [Cyanobacteria bacterium UBA11149]